MMIFPKWNVLGWVVQGHLDHHFRLLRIASTSANTVWCVKSFRVADSQSITHNVVFDATYQSLPIFPIHLPCEVHQVDWTATRFLSVEVILLSWGGSSVPQLTSSTHETSTTIRKNQVRISSPVRESVENVGEIVDFKWRWNHKYKQLFLQDM